jgi:hypothetical protein
LNDQAGEVFSQLQLIQQRGQLAQNRHREYVRSFARQVERDKRDVGLWKRKRKCAGHAKTAGGGGHADIRHANAIGRSGESGWAIAADRLLAQDLSERAE